jgi:hypothetical protein
MMKVYSPGLTAEQNAAFERFEALTSCEPFGMQEFERGEISGRELWEKNIAWIVGVANDAQQIPFPGDIMRSDHE